VSRLTDSQVAAIRAAGLTDTYWARKLGRTSQTIRDARIGARHKHIATPPDTAPRQGGGGHHWKNPAAIPARQRWSYFNV